MGQSKVSLPEKSAAVEVKESSRWSFRKTRWFPIGGRVPDTPKMAEMSSSSQVSNTYIRWVDICNCRKLVHTHHIAMLNYTHLLCSETYNLCSLTILFDSLACGLTTLNASL